MMAARLGPYISAIAHQIQPFPFINPLAYLMMRASSIQATQGANPAMSAATKETERLI
jgi:hypothetical protein